MQQSNKKHRKRGLVGVIEQSQTFMKTPQETKLERLIMNEPEASQDMQPKDKEPLEQERIPPPTDESPPSPVVPLVQGITITTRQGGEAGNFVCQICKKSFNSKAELDMHTESQHQQTQEKTQKKKTTRPHKGQSPSRKRTTKTPKITPL